MTATELRAVLTALGWGVRSLAHRLDINRRTVERWREGAEEVEPRVAAWLAGLAREVEDARASRDAAQAVIDKVIARHPTPPDWD